MTPQTLPLDQYEHQLTEKANRLRQIRANAYFGVILTKDDLTSKLITPSPLL